MLATYLRLEKHCEYAQMDEFLMHEDNVIILNYYIFVSDDKDSWTISFFGEILKPN